MFWCAKLTEPVVHTMSTRCFLSVIYWLYGTKRAQIETLQVPHDTRLSTQSTVTQRARKPKRHLRKREWKVTRTYRHSTVLNGVSLLGMWCHPSPTNAHDPIMLAKSTTTGIDVVWGAQVVGRGNVARKLLLAIPLRFDHYFDHDWCGVFSCRPRGCVFVCERYSWTWQVSLIHS